MFDSLGSANSGTGSRDMDRVLQDQYGFRTALVERLTRDLLGPGEEREIIDDAPIEQYIVGVLYPQSSAALSPEHDVDQDDEDEEASRVDPPVSLANRRYPSSVGLTFAVDTGVATTVIIEVTAARYEEIAGERGEPPVPSGSAPASPEGNGSEGATRSGRRSGRDEPASRWRRMPLKFEPVEVDVARPANRKVALGEGLELVCRVRPSDERGAASVTAVLVNGLVVRSGMRDASSFFQPSLKVMARSGEAAPFVERPSGMPPASDEDLRSYGLIYRHARNFGVGHGCAVEWTADVDDPARAASVWTTFVPRYELPLADSNPRIDESSLAMRFFAEGPRNDVAAALAALCDGYANWIESTARQSLSEFTGEPELAETAERHTRTAREALGRMRAGVALLRTHARAWEAFTLANAAMLEQRARAAWIRADTPGSGPTKDDSHRWRPLSDRVHPHVPRGHSEPGDDGDARRGRLAVVPDGRRQDGGLPRSDCLHRLPQAPTRARGRGRGNRPDALHAPAAHDPTVRAGHPPLHGMRGYPPRARRFGLGPDLDRAVGRPGSDPQLTPRYAGGTEETAGSGSPRGRGPGSTPSVSVVWSGARLPELLCAQRPVADGDSLRESRVRIRRRAARLRCG